MMNMNMGMNNMNINQGMINMNQIYLQISQLMAQAMININQIMTNMNQLMTNMNQMNQLINSMNGVQPNNNLNNINFMMNDIININKPNYNTHIIFKRLLNLEKYTINCNTSDKIKDVIQQYRIKSGDTRSDKFIHNNFKSKRHWKKKYFKLFNIFSPLSCLSMSFFYLYKR